ncbi:hypothetical protein [Pygmaiobacter massiliensis]|uniref:hypothetical protein n=1 Tax=Pygmaiobacter massiliensis TaxID=1917873 RepID=UPI000C798A6A|nr:hypothetical protein [Pygmaiobacter massiliensis]
MRIFNVSISIRPRGWLTDQEIYNYYNEKLRFGWELWFNGTVFDIFSLRKPSETSMYIFGGSEDLPNLQSMNCRRIHLMEHKNLLLLVEPKTEGITSVGRINPNIQKHACKVELSMAIVLCFLYNVLTLRSMHDWNVPMALVIAVCIILWSSPLSMVVSYIRSRQDKENVSQIKATIFSKVCTVLSAIGLFMPIAWHFQNVWGFLGVVIIITFGTAIGKYFDNKRIKEKMNL